MSFNRPQWVKWLFSLAATIAMAINYIRPFPAIYIIPIIVMICLYIVFFNENGVYKKYKKQMIIIYIIVLVYIIITDNYFSQGVYSKYNNLMVALMGPMWVVCLYAHKDKGK